MTAKAKAKARKLADAVRPFVDTLLLATATAELERERVDKIQRKVLAESVYVGATRDDSGATFRVTEPKDSWQMTTADSAKYLSTLDAIHLAEGFAKAADGYCPALTAENLKLKAEWALITAAEPFFDITNGQLVSAGKGKRAKYLELLIGLVVNMPGYRSPLKGKAI